MKELDFDELDRAVNSLMTDTSSLVAPASDTPAEKTLNLPDDPTAPDRPSFGILDADVAKDPIKEPEEETTSLTPPVKQAPLAIKRSSGRFMDVVHPSSDMKQQPTSKPFPSKQGITVSPTPSPIANPADVLKPTVPEPAEYDKVVDDQDDDAGNWPDPIDAAAKNSEFNESEPSTEAVKPTEEKQPLSSPFLADTKVEKRPLGGNNPAVSEELSTTPVETPIAEKADDQTILNPVDFQSSLPEEFSQDLLAIESGASQAVVDAEAKAAVTPVAEKPPVVATSSSAGVAQPAKVLIPDHFPDEDTPKGPASIPQQYREQPSSGDQSNGSIYDTDSYHKPLSHPAKKASGWLWVLWIVLILAIGAGIGAGLYYFGIVK